MLSGETVWFSPILLENSFFFFFYPIATSSNNLPNTGLRNTVGMTMQVTQVDRTHPECTHASLCCYKCTDCASFPLYLQGAKELPVTKPTPFLSLWTRISASCSQSNSSGKTAPCGPMSGTRSRPSSRGAEGPSTQASF